MKKHNKVLVTWIEFHEKEVELHKPVEDDTHDADDALEDAELMAGVGNRDSCIHYEVLEKEFA